MCVRKPTYVNIIIHSRSCTTTCWAFFPFARVYVCGANALGRPSPLIRRLRITADGVVFLSCDRATYYYGYDAFGFRTRLLYSIIFNIMVDELIYY